METLIEQLKERGFEATEYPGMYWRYGQPLSDFVHLSEAGSRVSVNSHGSSLARRNVPSTIEAIEAALDEARAAIQAWEVGNESV